MSPTNHELKELQVVLLTDSHWNTTDNTVYPHRNTAESNELRAAWSLRQEKEDSGSCLLYTSPSPRDPKTS
eukprot:3054964-Ditylum_brightwellii.AAC.1